MKVNTYLLLQHRMDGAVTSCLLYAIKAYHLGTGATFIRIYNFERVEYLQLHDPHSVPFSVLNIGVGMNPVPAVRGWRAFRVSMFWVLKSESFI
jgi:hypothetical protein